MVDLHTRLEKSVLRGVVHDVPYSSWILSVIERSSRLEASDWYDSAILGGLDALSSGITTVADITSTGAACTATQKLGMRGVIYREVGAMDKRRVDYAMRIAENDIMHWREEVDGDRISIGIAPAAVYANHPSVFSRVSECACKNDLPVAMRLAGSREEYNFVMYGSSMFAVHTMDDSKRGYVEIPPWMPTGVTPVRYALNWGAFESPNVLLVHAVHVDEEDIKKLREYNVSICTCARANAQLGMGVAPRRFSARGAQRGSGHRFARRDRVDRPAHRDARRHAHPPRGRHASFPRLDHHARARHHRRRPRLGPRRQDRLDRDRQVRRPHRRRSVQLTSGARLRSVSAVVNTCSASDVLMTMVNGKKLYEKNRWHVDVEVAKNIARVIEIRAKLRV